MLEIGWTIYSLVEGKLDLKIWLAIILMIVAAVVPFGCTILFVILKLAHCFESTWTWIILPIVMDIIGLIAEYKSAS